MQSFIRLIWRMPIQCYPCFAHSVRLCLQISFVFGMLFSGAFVALINIESQARQRIYCFFWMLKCKIDENATLFCRRSFDCLFAILQMNFSVLFIYIFMTRRDAARRDMSIDLIDCVSC